MATFLSSNPDENYIEPAQSHHATPETILALQDVGVVFADGMAALEHIALQLRPKEFVTIVGPSGCGKSTLLRVISGLLPASSGTVQVNRDSLGFTFQEPTLMPWRSVQQNIEVLLELRRVSRKKRRILVREHLQMMNLSAFAKHYPHQLSGGMKMRVSLARSLVLKPDLFLLDEPFASLDEITRQHLNQELLQLFSTCGFAALLVTHSIAEAVFMSSRVLVMSARPGRIAAEIVVPFAYPRANTLRYQPEFAQLCGTIAEKMRSSA